MSEKFILVKPNADARHPRLTDPIVSQDYPNPKIFTLSDPAHVGIIYVNWSSSIAVAQNTTKLIDSFPHGFSYIPTVFATFKFDNGSVQREGTLPFQYGALGMILIDADAININLKYFSLDLAGTTLIPAFTMQVRYYVMVEPGY